MKTLQLKPGGNKLTAESTRCPVKGCGGALWNTTPKLAIALNVIHLTCHECKESWAFNVSDTNQVE